MEIFVNPDAENKFCKLKNLNNESSVEQFFIMRLLADLEYTDSFIKTKDVLPWKDIGRGSKKEKYRPDYMLYVGEAEDRH